MSSDLSHSIGSEGGHEWQKLKPETIRTKCATCLPQSIWPAVMIALLKLRSCLKGTTYPKVPQITTCYSSSSILELRFLLKW